VATALLARGQRPASPAKASPPPPDPEQQLLTRFIVPAACRYLEDENTRSRLKGLTPAARQERLNQAALTAATPHAPALRKQYGERVLTDPQQRAALSKKNTSVHAAGAPVFGAGSRGRRLRARADLARCFTRARCAQSPAPQTTSASQETVKNTTPPWPGSPTCATKARACLFALASAKSAFCRHSATCARYLPTSQGYASTV